MGNEVGEVLSVSLQAKIDQFEGNLKQAANTADNRFAAIERRAREAGDRMQSAMGDAANNVKNTLLGIGAAFGVVLLPGFSHARPEGACRPCSDIGLNAKKAGMDLEAFQKLTYVAEQNRVSVEALTQGMHHLQEVSQEFIDTGEGGAKEALKQIEMSADQLKEGLKNPTSFLCN